MQMIAQKKKKKKTRAKNNPYRSEGLKFQHRFTLDLRKKTTLKACKACKSL